MKIRFPNTRQGISLPLWFRDEKFIFSRNEKLQFVQSSLPESLTSFIGRLMLNERKTSQKVSNDENITETSNTKSSTMERKKLFNPNKKYPVLSDKVSVRWDLLKCLKKYLFTYLQQIWRVSRKIFGCWWRHCSQWDYCKRVSYCSFSSQQRMEGKEWKDVIKLHVTLFYISRATATIVTVNWVMCHPRWRAVHCPVRFVIWWHGVLLTANTQLWHLITGEDKWQLEQWIILIR